MTFSRETELEKARISTETETELEFRTSLNPTPLLKKCNLHYLNIFQELNHLTSIKKNEIFQTFNKTANFKFSYLRTEMQEFQNLYNSDYTCVMKKQKDIHQQLVSFIFGTWCAMFGVFCIKKCCILNYFAIDPFHIWSIQTSARVDCVVICVYTVIYLYICKSADFMKQDINFYFGIEDMPSVCRYNPQYPNIEICKGHIPKLEFVKAIL